MSHTHGYKRRHLPTYLRLDPSFSPSGAAGLYSEKPEGPFGKTALPGTLTVPLAVLLCSLELLLMTHPTVPQQTW